MIDRFLEQWRADAFDAANADGGGELRLNALLEVILEQLEESGIVGDCHVAFLRRERSGKTSEVHAYCIDTEDDLLTLFYFVDANESEGLGDRWEPRSVGKDLLDKGLRRLATFVSMATGDRLGDVEESQPAAELVTLVKECADSGRSVALCVLTSGTISDRAVTPEPRDGMRCEVWDLLRLSRMCGGAGDEPVTVDFANEYGCALPCLTTPEAKDHIQVLLAAVPGAVLANVYNTYRARVLERNVRSFLQFNGKVNKGIRLTILDAPERFLSYNNGIAATASHVELRNAGNGTAEIAKLVDFQIVNGGQTTASIAAALRRDKADLGRLSVAMKVTVVPHETINVIVPEIARYANTQNRIQEADFSANDPWHIALERLSRETWTGPTEASPRGSRWYYERSRGQFADELASNSTSAGKKKFRAENPASQKFTKTDLAKYTLSWHRRPFVVSRGAQKAFQDFMAQLRMSSQGPPEKRDLERIVAQALLFKVAEQAYGELGFTGYRAQVVTYAVARLSHELQSRMPWEDIWKEQEVPKAIVDALKILLIGIRDRILSPPTGRNITEWTKREECWTTVLEVPVKLKLPDASAWAPHDLFGLPSSKPAAGGALADAVVAIPASAWFEVSGWAKANGHLQGWQRSLAFSLGRLLATGRVPSHKQAVQGRRLFLQAVELGFAHTEVSASQIEALEAAPEDPT